MPAFDRGVYVSLPRTTVRRKLALARLLLRHQPPSAGADLHRHTASLAAAAASVEELLSARGRASMPKHEAELDNLADALWTAVCERLEHWRAFTLPAARRFTEIQLQTPDPVPGKSEGAGCDYAGHLAKAATISRARALLLGSGGVVFAGLEPADQAEQIRKLWRFVDEDGLEPVLAEAIGPEFLASLRDVQTRYLDQLEAQVAESRAASASFREQAARLDRAVQTYVLALLVALDESDAASLAQTRAALRPIDALHVQLGLDRRVAAGRAAANEALEDESVAEFVAEEQAVDEALDGRVEDEDRDWAFELAGRAHAHTG